MKKKFLQIVSMVLAVVMILPMSVVVSADSTITLYCDGTEKKTTTLTAQADDSTWDSDDPAIASVGTNGLVTAVSEGTTKIREYDAEGNEQRSVTSVTVVKRKCLSIEVSGNYKKEYYSGESFDPTGMVVTATFDNGDKVDVNTYDYSPKQLRVSTSKVTVTYAEKTADTQTLTIKEVIPQSIKIVSPTKTQYNVDDIISDVEIEVTNNDGSVITVSSGFDQKPSATTKLKVTDTKLVVEYEGLKTELAIVVKDDKPAETASAITNTKDANGYISPTSAPTKTKYTVGEKFDATGMTLYLTYSDASKNYWFTFPTISLSAFSSASTNASVTLTLLTDKYGNSFKVKVSGLTVEAGATATEIDNDEDEYELYDKEDIKLEIGDKLNDDIKWDDIFKEVSVKIDGKWKTIEDDRDLEDYPGVELLLKVYNKSDDEIKASHLNSDGEVNIQLYIKNGSSTVTSSSKTICVYIPVAEAECTVSIYSSKTSTSSTYLKSTKTFSDFEDALAALKDEDELEDVFDVTLGTNYAIRIKFGEDQVLGSSYEFEPDYENPITIDLNGHELKLPSDWIVYDDCEDLVVTVTNNNDDEDGSLVYRDKSVTLTVAEGSELEFSEDNIPMDSDAECTVSIYKSSSYTTSSYLIKTKVYETLKEALEDLEDHDEAMETFDIDEDYEDTFAVRMKLGEDQDLGTYTFAPDYDTTITIDLNGYELELESDWIDYEDCEDLVVKIDNNNTSKKGTLKYGDMTSTTISLSSSDAVLTFEEDKIPGLYTVTIGSVTNGTVTASPNKTTVGKGSTVTFTITPSEGYVIDTVKSGTKTITTSTSGYTVSSKGVGTYKLENISADVKLDVTFKKGSSSTSSSTSSSSSANWTNPFTDVSKNAQYYDAVAFVCSEGLFNGMTATKFEPTTTMTRAMFVTVLGRLAGVDVMKYSGTSFTDVSKTDQQISWAAPYIEWAVQVGLTNGTGNGKFSPNDPITHQQMYLFMYRYAMSIENITTPLTGVSLSGISDAGQIADWAEDGVKFASKNGILITSGGKLTPTENALRCELAMLLHGFCTKVLDK